MPFLTALPAQAPTRRSQCAMLIKCHALLPICKVLWVREASIAYAHRRRSLM